MSVVEEPAMPRAWGLVRRRPAVTVALVAAAVGAASLLGGDALAYDPTAWEIWARELAHGSLTTAGAAVAWKPLPVLFDLPFTFLGGGVAVAAWLIAVRAASVVAVVAAWALGRRVAGTTAALGAAVATAALLGGRFATLVAGGFSEPVSAAAFLLAVWAALRRTWTTALALLLVASLVRPEAWPFLAVVAAVVVRRAPHRARGIATAGGALVAVPVAWFVPDWVTTGDPLRSLHTDALAVTGGPLHSPHPGLTVISDAAASLPRVALVAAVVTVLVAARRAPRPALLAVIPGVAWICVEAVATQLHSSSGDTRYLLPGLATVAALAGAAPGVLLQWLVSVRRARARWAAVAAPVAAGVLAFVMTPVSDAAAARAAWTWQAQQTAADATLDLLTDRPAFDAALRCGSLMAGNYQVPLVAWMMRVPLQDVRAPQTVKGVLLTQDGAPGRVPRSFRRVVRVGPVPDGWTWWESPTCARRARSRVAGDAAPIRVQRFRPHLRHA